MDKKSTRSQRTQKRFAFEITARDGAARLGRITTSRGLIDTPCFMPVGTRATVKALYLEQLTAMGAQIILANTYHLMLQPGAERVNRLGGLHEFMNWSYPILTDSGGFQVMSLAGLRRIDEDGVHFRSHIDGSAHYLTPERCMEIQDLIGSDIQMQLDECVKLPADKEQMARAMNLSLRWAERCRREFNKRDGEKKGHALYGIVQGGNCASLRRQSAENLTQMEFEGYAIGGLAVGEPAEEMYRVIDALMPDLPDYKPRYLMGVGTPENLLEASGRGVDQFDCVMPTRAGRHGLAYTRRGKVNLRNARHADDKRPLDETSACPAARDYCRGYLHHLVRTGEPLGAMLLSWNNVAYYQQLMSDIRAAINAGNFEDFRSKCLLQWSQGDLPPL